MRIALLWLADCPNHERAGAIVQEVLAAEGVRAVIERIEIPDEATGIAHCFPGSPTLRVNGVDVEPNWEPCEDCTPRCRVYMTPDGLRGIPERAWIVAAIRAAV
jgi:hypothetical protein